ncbi:unnamed protein product, partial [Cyprideis torosa]
VVPQVSDGGRGHHPQPGYPPRPRLHLLRSEARSANLGSFSVGLRFPVRPRPSGDRPECHRSHVVVDVDGCVPRSVRSLPLLVWLSPPPHPPVHPPDAPLPLPLPSRRRSLPSEEAPSAVPSAFSVSLCCSGGVRVGDGVCVVLRPLLCLPSHDVPLLPDPRGCDLPFHLPTGRASNS